MSRSRTRASSGETKRLLAETDERAAELAIINSVQQGLAEKLDMQAMYDLVGDKIQEIFDAQVVDIGIYDREADLMQFPYTIERGVRFPDEPISLLDPGPLAGTASIGIRLHVMEKREPVLANTREEYVRVRRSHSSERRARPVDAVGPARRRRRGEGRDLAPEPRPRERVHRVGRPTSDHARRRA